MNDHERVSNDACASVPPLILLPWCFNSTELNRKAYLWRRSIPLRNKYVYRGKGMMTQSDIMPLKTCGYIHHSAGPLINYSINKNLKQE